MKHWLTASVLSFGLAICCLPALATDVSTPTLKISYAMAGAALPGQDDTTDLWDRIRAGFSLPETNPDLVKVHEAWFAKHPEHVERIAERSRLYLYYIAEPMEIALLPMIESAFNPMAQSPQKASGIWQFIPSTGRVYGLPQNGWYDGRRDVVQATQAALDHLQKLHDMFNDWELALAAYNCGEGCVLRAMARSHTRTFSKLKLPTETRHYVPKLVALRNIVKQPENYGIQLDPMANEPYFMPVSLKQPIEARTAAQLAEMSLEDFDALNPGFQRRVIHTDTRGVLLLPADRVETFQFNLHRKGLDKGTLESYPAKRGESVANIANKFHVSVDWLKAHNPIKPAHGKLVKTQELVVPKVASLNTPAKARVSVKAGKQTAAMRKHTVRPGETLSKLAQQYQVRVSDIQRLNDITDQLKPGMELEIPARIAG